MTEDVLIKLAIAGQQAPSADNSQPWFYSQSNGSLNLHVDQQKLLGSCFDAHHPAILLAIGAVVENIIQAADYYQVKLRFKIFPPKTDGLCAVFNMEENLGYEKALPLGEKEIPDFAKRHTNRLPYRKKTIPVDVVNQLLVLSSERVKIVAYHKKEQIQQWADWIKIASEARFQSPDIHQWFGQTLKFTPEEVKSGEGLDVESLQLPALGNFLLKATQTWEQMERWNKFYAYKLLAKIESINVGAAPLLMGVVAPMGEIFTLEAGRIMEKMWIKANGMGLSVQPYFVVPDQLYRLQKGLVPVELRASINGLQNEINEVLKLDHQFVCILFRLGYCDKSVIKSRRHSVKIRQ